MKKIQATIVVAAIGICTLASIALSANPSGSPAIREGRPSIGDRQKLGACVQGPKYNDHNKRAMFVIEAETLLGKGKVQVNGGNLAVQSMAGFGPGWGGDAQLFWSGGAAGAVLDITYIAPIGGRYDIYLQITRAPDYGKVKTQYSGGPDSGGLSGGYSFDGWGPAVEPPYFYAGPPTNYGHIVTSIARLKAGENKLAVMIWGKNQQSSGYLVGIDCIVLHRYPEHAQ